MDIQQLQKEKLNHFLNRLQITLTDFTEQILKQFQKSFNELDQFYKTKYSSQIQTIDDQDEQIQEIKKWMNDIHAKTQEFMEGVFGGEKIENGINRMRGENEDE